MSIFSMSNAVSHPLLVSGWTCNVCAAVLTDKLADLKAENLSIKQMLDQTLMEMCNI